MAVSVAGRLPPPPGQPERRWFDSRRSSRSIERATSRPSRCVASTSPSRRATVVAIMGRSGSGKSTLLNLVSGSDRPTAGRVLIDGTDIGRADEAVRAQLRGRVMGIIFQSQNLLPFLTLEENVVLTGRLAGSELDGSWARELLDRVGLADRAGHRPDQLSGGEQQRGGLACVLAAKPRLLLADEMTGELDSATATRLLDLVRDVRRTEGMTVVMVTHDESVAQTADRIVELRDGRVVADRQVR